MPVCPLGRCGGLVIIAALAASAPAHSQNFTDAVFAGTPLIDIRLRHETVDQSNKLKDAQATTIRARLGYATGAYEGFSALFEFDFVQHLGPKWFNDSINGRTAYPAIADPDMATLNRLQIGYAAHLFSAGPDAPADMRLTLGRQRITFGDGRFVGNAGWRQHEQTYDALSVVDSPLPGATFSYAYVTRVNLIFGPGSRNASFDSDSHFFNAVYSGVPHLKLEGYAYLLDLKQAPTLSAATYGARVDGNFDLGAGVTANLNGAAAQQDDYGRNPHKRALGYRLVEASLGYRGFSGLAGYEVLEGDGVMGFQTPLANLHLFQGWAETFVTKPPNGLRDFYLKASYAIPAVPSIGRIVPTFVYHKFSAQHVSADYGSEWDAMLEAQIDAHTVLDIAYADYRGAGPFPDKRVFWAYATYRY